MLKTDLNILRFPSLDSTNTYAINTISSLPHNTVIIADTQTKGRGRLERRWVSDSTANLYVSIVIRPEEDYHNLPLVNFTQFFSVVVSDILVQYDVQPQIKWPNDIMVNHKKICGILSEVSFSGGVFNGIVVGIGLNIADTPDLSTDRNQDTTSLSHEAGTVINKEEVLDRMLNEYLHSYSAFVTNGFSGIYDAYRCYFPFFGEHVAIANSNRNISGVVHDISSSGELVIDDTAGEMYKISLGDMIWTPCR